MKTIKLLLVAPLLLGAVLFQDSLYAKTADQVARDVEKATNSAVRTYKQQGMTGLIAKTESCYRNTQANPFYCVYLDLASRRIDQLAAENMNFPPNEFFADEQFGSRIGPIFSRANFDTNTANKFLQSATPVINNSVEKKFLGKR